MTADYATWSAEVRKLCDALATLEPRAAELGVPPQSAAEWHQLLFRKLRPQSDGGSPVVAAVVGGTNIGKSALFNQLAGEDAGAVSPFAAGTKHPVCLTPRTVDERLLATLFDGFTLRPWQAAETALVDDAADLLFWRTSDALPPRLLLLDTPDVDSDVVVNWRRADAVRHAADVLIAVLTQQKYNDAAVKRFFRHAAEADKAVIVVFNQVDVELDRDVWPEWLAVFTRETGVAPLAAYVVPYDRRGAQSRGLEFRAVGVDGRAYDPTPVDLRRELSELRYDELKRRTLGGATARVVDPQTGVDRYVREVRTASAHFAAARKALVEARRVGTSWPALPARVLVDEIRAWWDDHRSPWSRKIHGVYRSVGRAVVAPVRRLWGAGAEPTDPLAAYRERERDVVVEGVERLLDELERLATVGNDILRPRIAALLGGTARAQLLQRVQTAHAALPPVDAEFREFLRAEMDAWRRDNPRAASVIRSLDEAAAFARPAITVTLALTGVFLPAGDVLGQAVVHAAGQTAGEIATAAVVTGGGEAAIGAAGEGIKHAAAQLFRRLQTEHARRRAAALTSLFEHELLGGLLEELQHGAQLAEDDACREVGEAASVLRAHTRNQPDA